MSAASRITELRSDKYSFSSMNYTIASAITNSNSDLAFCDCYRTIRRMADKIPLTEQALKLKALVDQAGGLVPFAFHCGDGRELTMNCESGVGCR